MCWFLFLQIPADSIEEFRKALPSDLNTHSISPPQVRSNVGKTVIHITEEMCSCGLYRDSALSESEKESKQRLKYSKRGWSDAKIERALHQTKTSRQHKPKWLGKGLRPDLREAFAGLVPVLGELRLIVCWTPTERQIHELMDRPLHNLSTRHLIENDESISPETLYEIHSSAPLR